LLPPHGLGHSEPKWNISSTCGLRSNSAQIEYEACQASGYRCLDAPAVEFQNPAFLLPKPSTTGRSSIYSHLDSIFAMSKSFESRTCGMMSKSNHPRCRNRQCLCLGRCRISRMSCGCLILQRRSCRRRGFFHSWPSPGVPSKAAGSANVEKSRW